MDKRVNERITDLVSHGVDHVRYYAQGYALDELKQALEYAIQRKPKDQSITKTLIAQLEREIRKKKRAIAEASNLKLFFEA